MSEPTSGQRKAPKAADGRSERAELKVFITGREAQCGACEAKLGHHAWIFLVPERGALCLSCADLDHLVFLPSGSAALTRRAKAGSALSAVVLKWAKARKRYERQGLLVESEALDAAEAECLADSEVRLRRSLREAERRADLDATYVAQFAARVRELFPGCPPGREQTIAEHACLKYSDRVGRSAAAKALDQEAIGLAVQAHIRHRETDYDAFLARGLERSDARSMVRANVEAVMASWRR
jgi:hypothetical protein